MLRLHTFLVLALVSLSCATISRTACADPIYLVGGVNVQWNVATSPTQAPALTVQIYDGAASPTAVFNGFALGVYVVPSGSNSLVLNTSTGVNNPASPWPVTSWVPSPWADVVPLPNEYYLGNQATDTSDNFAVPTTPVNLVALTFQPAAGTPAVGSTFQIWADGVNGLATYDDANGDAATAFANATNTTGDFLLATITAVPEPSTVASLISGLGMLGIGWGYRWCRRRRAAA